MYKPSLWGFTASAVFIVLTAVALQDSEWIDALMWGLFAVSFALKYLPKFLIFSAPGTLVSFIALVAGIGIFIAYAADRFDSGTPG